jgi:putative restriction endonuclease
MFDSVHDLDTSVRLAAFAWLSEQTTIHGNVLSRTLLLQGFPFHDRRIHIVSRQGIFKPKELRIPLSITTSPKSTYNDSANDDLLRYHYRGQDPSLTDNRGLREAMSQQKPLVYFYGVRPGWYHAVWPVYIIGDDRNGCMFTASVDDSAVLRGIGAEPDEGRRAYITRLTTQRLHQGRFRENVLVAYRDQCALCHLRHYELLDAAHILPDKHPQGIAAVRNGLSLCKLHHAAYDANILGVTPEYRINVRGDILEEEDGPMLQHGLKGMHGNAILLPRRIDQRPDRNFLDERYQQFLKAS